MNDSRPNAAVLWTGGKDSALALHEAQRDGCRVSHLVTFAPPEARFLAHPLELIKLQAEAMGLPHVVWPVREPFDESYETGLRWLKDTLNVDTVITGDIAEVAGYPNWIRERCQTIDMDVVTPLWGRERDELLRQLVTVPIQSVFSCIKTKWLTADWIGRELDEAMIAQLRSAREQNGLDLCGEEGEYHTFVTDAPVFRRRLRLVDYRVRKRDDLAYLEIDRAELVDKQSRDGVMLRANRQL